MSYESFLPTPPSEEASASSRATIYLPTAFHPKAEEAAEKLFHKVLRGGEVPEDEALAESDGVLLRLGTMRKHQLEKAPRLKAICRNGTGLDGIDLDECKRRGVVVTNVPGGNAKEVAELALTLALSLLRRVKHADQIITSGERLLSIKFLAPGLRGKTVGLIGMGDIAYETALLFMAFDCKFVVYSPSSPAHRWSGARSDKADRFPVPIPHVRATTLDDLLPVVDVLSLHCPLTPRTVGMIGARELGLIKPGAVLVNTSRGGIVDELALAEALKSGRVFGAGLEVFATEPAFGENLGELGKMPNVICLPHLGSSTDEGTYIGCMRAIDEMVNILDGRGSIHRVV